jgi:hypothetical protein
VYHKTKTKAFTTIRKFKQFILLSCVLFRPVIGLSLAPKSSVNSRWIMITIMVIFRRMSPPFRRVQWTQERVVVCQYFTINNVLGIIPSGDVIFSSIAIPIQTEFRCFRGKQRALKRMIALIVIQASWRPYICARKCWGKNGMRSHTKLVQAVKIALLTSTC